MLITLSVVLLIYAGVRLIGYSADYAASKQTTNDLRQKYQEAVPTSEPVTTLSPSSQPITLIPTETKATPTSSLITPSPTVLSSLIPLLYPDNPKLQISSRFKALRKENKDIVGWLKLGDLLDEAVVQRDEVYYMTHDALGKKNVNGAIFLDSGISLKTRPYALILYGHNMKTGAMFGCLRNYENIGYYHNEPFISYDTMYEEGRYVIFAVGTINTVEHVRNYVDLYAFRLCNIRNRQKAIEGLISTSIHSCSVDVQPDDQLLLLVTCVENNNERRVVAARRIRDGESEAEVKKLVERSWKK